MDNALLRTLVIAGLILHASSTAAETFKCAKPGGASYYSDVPCGTDKTVRIEQTLATSSGGQVSLKLLGRMNDLCKASIKDWLPYKDPVTLAWRESNRTSGKNVSFKSGKNPPQAAIRINLEASSKSTSSRYGSTEYYYCYVTPSDMPTILGIYTQLME